MVLKLLFSLGSSLSRPPIYLFPLPLLGLKGSKLRKNIMVRAAATMMFLLNDMYVFIILRTIYLLIQGKRDILVSMKGVLTMKAYKLLRVKSDGNLYPLFINKTTPTPVGVWMEAECFPTKGFAVRQGWHCCFKPIAPHLKQELANGEKRIWVEVEVEGWTKYDRPESQGGAWILADRMMIVRRM